MGRLVPESGEDGSRGPLLDWECLVDSRAGNFYWSLEVAVGGVSEEGNWSYWFRRSDSKTNVLCREGPNEEILEI